MVEEGANKTLDLLQLYRIQSTVQTARYGVLYKKFKILDYTFGGTTTVYYVRAGWVPGTVS
jgi:hypothetical protein